MQTQDMNIIIVINIKFIFSNQVNHSYAIKNIYLWNTKRLTLPQKPSSLLYEDSDSPLSISSSLIYNICPFFGFFGVEERN